MVVKYSLQFTTFTCGNLSPRHSREEKKIILGTSIYLLITIYQQCLPFIPLKHPVKQKQTRMTKKKKNKKKKTLDAALPIRGTRSSFTNQNIGTSFTHQESIQGTDPTPPIEGRLHKQEELQSYILLKGDPKHNKLNKMRRQKTCSR